MRLSTIWSLPAMTTLERFRRTGDWAARELAAHLPSRVRYWSTMIAVAKATSTGVYSPGGVMAAPLDDVLKKLEGSPK
jgi:hypothetical protein